MPEENLPQINTQQQHQSTAEAQTPTDQGISDALSRLDIEMKEILNADTYKSDREKWTAYLAVLHRYLHYNNSKRLEQYLALVEKKKNETENEEEGMSGLSHKGRQTQDNSMNDSIIIESIPSKFRGQAKLLLQNLHAAPPPAFSWDSTGVVFLSGKQITIDRILSIS